MDPNRKKRVVATAFENAMIDDGSLLSGYKTLAEIDRGGMAMVYHARQLEPEREVAVKVMLPKFADDETTRHRFQSEGRTMAALDHPGILPVYEVGESEGIPFISMKLANGGSLKKWLQENDPNTETIVQWIVDVADAVHFAHQHGVLHRDIKPDNLLFDQIGKIYVGDFGVAKRFLAEDAGLTQTAAIVGTPYYLPPEIAGGAASSASIAGDVYSLGVVFYECLTGKKTHARAESLAGLFRSIAEDPIDPPRSIRPEIPQDLGVICLKALEKDPNERYRSAADFRDDLIRFQKGQVIHARPAGAIKHLTKWGKRHPLSVGLLTALLVMALVAAALLQRSYHSRGEALHKAFVDQARAERLIGKSGWRSRAQTLLHKAEAYGQSPEMREQKIAALGGTDIVKAASFIQPELVQGEDQLPETLIEDARFARISPNGTRVAIGGAEGLRIIELGSKKLLWQALHGAVRCNPAWSNDGRFLAAGMGERQQIMIFEALSGTEFSTYQTPGWPEELAFHPNNEHLAVIGSERCLMLIDCWGRKLFGEVEVGEGAGLHFSEDGSHFWLATRPDANWRIDSPVGVRDWTGQHLAPDSTTVFGGSISPDDQRLVTPCTNGLQLWDVKRGLATGLYKADNQRIDARTEAWWLDHLTLLLQIPGGLEKIRITETGEIDFTERVPRMPGARIINIEANGDWIVSIRDEEGAGRMVRWESGKEDLEATSIPHYSSLNTLRDEAAGTVVSLRADGAILVQGRSNLTLPAPMGTLRQLLLTSGGNRLIGITEDYRILEWDLKLIAETITP